MEGLQVLMLPHEPPERAGPPLREDVRPLQVHRREPGRGEPCGGSKQGRAAGGGGDQVDEGATVGVDERAPGGGGHGGGGSAAAAAVSGVDGGGGEEERSGRRMRRRRRRMGGGEEGMRCRWRRERHRCLLLLGTLWDLWEEGSFFDLYYYFNLFD